MSEALLIQVAMGELRLARNGETLAALLGSCVGIGMLWPRKNSVALAHCLLPHSPEAGTRHGARYVSQAVPSLLTLLGVRREERAEITVILAGGANMFGPAGVSSGVGASNIAAAHKVLAEYGMAVQHEATGGRRGRTIRVDARDGSYSIIKVERNVEEPGHASL
jgi:chemotaxis protein CheD